MKCLVRLEDPRDAQRAISLFTPKGWSATTDTAEPTDLLLDIITPHMRFFAVGAVKADIEQATKGIVACRVAEATRVDTNTPPTQHFVGVEAADPSWGKRRRALWGLVTRAGLGRIGRVLELPAPPGQEVPTPEDALRASQKSPLRDANPIAAQFIKPIGGRPRGRATTFCSLVRRIPANALAAVCMWIPAVMAITSEHLMPAWWQFLLLGAVCYPLGRQFGSNAPRLPTTYVMLGAVICAPMWILGLVYRTALDDLNLANFIGAILLLATIYGLVRLSRTPLANPFWKTTAIVIPLAVGATWISDIGWEAYATSGFGIPSEALRTTAEGALTMSATPIAAILCLYAIGAALIGILSDVSVPSTRPTIITMIGSVFLSFAATSAGIGIFSVADAYLQTRQQASDGRQPTAYAGIQPRLVRVCPTTASPIAVTNGPLPTDRALLTLPTKDGRIWLSDPTTWNNSEVPTAMSIDQNDASTHAWSPRNTCPTVK